jgi:hypothetical protein
MDSNDGFVTRRQIDFGHAVLHLLFLGMQSVHTPPGLNYVTGHIQQLD